jgi:toxin ParE1/3/4
LRKLLKKPLAESDLIDIWFYSFENWGEEQANSYLKALGLQLAKLKEFPMLGKPRDELRPGYRSLQIQRHLAFYLLTEEAVEIVRVLHVSMEPGLHLEF